MTTLFNIPSATVDLDTAFIQEDKHWSSESRERAGKSADQRRFILYAQAPDMPNSRFILDIKTCWPRDAAATRALLWAHLEDLKSRAAATPFLC